MVPEPSISLCLRSIHEGEEITIRSRRRHAASEPKGKQTVPAAFCHRGGRLHAHAALDHSRRVLIRREAPPCSPPHVPPWRLLSSSQAGGAGRWRLSTERTTGHPRCQWRLSRSSPHRPTSRIDRSAPTIASRQADQLLALRPSFATLSVISLSCRPRTGCATRAGPPLLLCRTTRGDLPRQVGAHPPSFAHHSVQPCLTPVSLPLRPSEVFCDLGTDCGDCGPWAGHIPRW